jgi:hypothetical protein
MRKSQITTTAKPRRQVRSGEGVLDYFEMTKARVIIRDRRDQSKQNLRIRRSGIPNAWQFAKNQRVIAVRNDAFRPFSLRLSRL